MSSLQICDGSALITVVDGQAPASPAAAAATSALRQLYGSQKQIPFNFGFSEVKVPCDVVSVRIGVTDGSRSSVTLIYRSNSAAIISTRCVGEHFSYHAAVCGRG